MKFTYACKKVSLNDSIKEYAEKKISKLERYFREEDTTASVTFAVEKDHLCTVEITIRGGGALLRGLDTLINRETGITVHIAENPLDCVAMGIGKCLDEGKVEMFSSQQGRY